MSHKRQRRRVFLVLLIPLWLLLLGCGLCGGFGLAPHPPDRSLHISEEEADALLARWKEAWQEAGQADQVELRITEDELTSFLNLRLMADKNVPVREPKVWFDPGVAYIEGRLDIPQVPMNPQVLLVLTARVEDDKLQIDLVKGALGPLPMPKSILSTLDESIDALLENLYTNFTVQSVRLEEGVLIVTLAR
ncbi:MAG: hypothetical protein GXP39_04100 [Chloroflexi bacterium]|nr:hypothetical protein [Chloroflexota bacterium]